MRTIGLLTSFVLACFTNVNGQASPGDERHGFWAGVVLGAGNAGGECNSCGGIKRATGLSGLIRVGATLSKGFGLGVEGTGWGRTKSDVDQSLRAGAVVLLWNPKGRGGISLILGAGITHYSATSTLTNDVVDFTAPSGSLSLGYELSVSRSVAVGSLMTIAGTLPVNPQRNDMPFPTDENMSILMVRIGLSLTWHP